MSNQAKGRRRILGILKKACEMICWHNTSLERIVGESHIYPGEVDPKKAVVRMRHRWWGEKNLSCKIDWLSLWMQFSSRF
jgi:hypothetical protein